jgi:hypothetical protein
MLLRIFWFKIVVVLCVSYSTVVAKTSSVPTYHTTKYNNTYEQTTLTANDTQNKFDPFELIEKDEQNEISEEDYDSQHTSLCSLSLHQNTFQFKYQKTKIPALEFSEFTSPKKLFIVFHCWKLHS